MNIPWRPNTSILSCCRTMSNAHERGSDNEGYGALICYTQEGPEMGDGLPPIKFCPWCGREVVLVVIEEPTT
jgi:hypothetical protein